MMILSVILYSLLELSVATTYLVTLRPHGDLSPSDHLQHHLDELSHRLPHASILYAYYNLADVGVPSYAVEINATKDQLREAFPAIDDLEHTTWLHLTNSEDDEEEDVEEEEGVGSMSEMRNIVNFIPYDTSESISKIIDQPLLNKEAQCTIEYSSMTRYREVRAVRRSMMRGQQAPVRNFIISPLNGCNEMHTDSSSLRHNSEHDVNPNTL